MGYYLASTLYKKRKERKRAGLEVENMSSISKTVILSKIQRDTTLR
jgi:hypothetical protein